MASRNADCRYEQSLRARTSERPQPLKRGQGVGGGNYRRINSNSGPVRCADLKNTASKPCPSNQGRPQVSNRAKSISPNNSRPSTASSGFSNSSCPQNVSQPPQSRQRSQQPTSVPGTSKVECQRPLLETGKPGQKRQTTARPSSAGTCTSQRTPEAPSRTNKKIPSSCPPLRNRQQGDNFDALRPNCNTRSNVRGLGTAPQSSDRSRVTGRSVNPQKRSSPQSSKPGSSCIKASTSVYVTGRKVQFAGVASPECGPTPDSRSMFKASNGSKAFGSNGMKRSCEAGPGASRRSETPVYGPSVYPIYPDQYETPYVSLPGPRQVLLMPGDIDPNETTIIDIVGLDEGDVVEVPGIPQQNPTSLLEDTWNEYTREAEQGYSRRRTNGEQKSSSIGNRGRKKTNLQKCNSNQQEKTYPFEKYGNVRIRDGNKPSYGGTNYQRSDPECQRARPFTYDSRKTAIRPLTDEERREIEEAQTYRAIKAIINEYDARWESDRMSRGLTDNDLLDVDDEDCAPEGAVQTAPRDIFEATDNCSFGDTYSLVPPLEVPTEPRVQCSQYQDLIAWDDTAMPPVSYNNTDLLTRTPPKSVMDRRATASPDLINMWEPDVDLIGLRSPPRSKPPLPPPQSNRNDLIQWNSPPQRTLPFDDPCEESVFDRVTQPSPTAARLRPPQKRAPSPRVPGGKGEPQKPFCASAGPSNEPRVVRAVPLENDPNIVVLESSPLASRKSAPDECGLPAEESDSCLDIFDFEGSCGEPWQQLDNFVEDFHKPLPSSRSRVNKDNLPGVSPLEDCEDDDDMGLLDDDCLPDFELSNECEGRQRDQGKPKSTYQPLTSGFEFLSQERCPFDPDFEEFDRQFEEERADLLNLCHEPDVGPVRRQDMGRFGTELVDQCKDPIEECADLLGLLEPPKPSTPKKKFGPFSRELLENCPEEQQLIDLDDDDCQPEQPPCPPKFNYSRDLFTNVQWDPSMASKPQVADIAYGRSGQMLVLYLRENLVSWTSVIQLTSSGSTWAY